MTVYEPRPDNALYGLHIPYDQGLDVTSQNAQAKTKRAEVHDSSGYLKSPTLNAQIELWVEEVAADFTMSGSTGQSRSVREWFPRSFNDVTVTITGKTANSYEHNRLAAFVREAQWRALQKVDGGGAADVIEFFLHDNTNVNFRGLPARPAFGGTRQSKGAHRPWQLFGYVRNMKAGAIRHDYAPEFSIDFVVSRSAQGIWSEEVATIQALATFLDLYNIQKAKGGVYVTNPKAKPPASSGAKVTAQSVWSVAAATGVATLTPGFLNFN